MKFIPVLATAALLSIAAIAPSYAAMSEADCNAMFTTLDKNGDGTLGGLESAKFVAKMDSTDVTAAESRIVKQDEFLAACVADKFAGMTAE